MICPVCFLLCLGITILSLLPGSYLPPQTFNIWDKAQHAGAFLLLSLMALHVFPKRTGSVVCGLLLYGAVIEVAQSATGWRYGDWQDLLADAVGVWAGFAVWWLWQRFVYLRKESTFQ